MYRHDISGSALGALAGVQGPSFWNTRVPKASTKSAGAVFTHSMTIGGFSSACADVKAANDAIRTAANVLRILVWLHVVGVGWSAAMIGNPNERILFTH